MILRATALLLVVGLCFSSPGFSGLAKAEVQASPEARKACEADAHRLCDEFIPNEEEIAGCLRKQMKQLSPACRAIMSHK